MFSLKAALLVFVAVHEQRVALVVYTWDLLLSDWCTLMLCLLHLLTFCTYVHWFDFVLVSNCVLHLRVLAGFGVFGANSTGVWRRTRIIDCRLCQMQVLAAHVPELLFKMRLSRWGSCGCQAAAVNDASSHWSKCEGLQSSFRIRHLTLIAHTSIEFD